jgi:hypothetical protein
MAIESKSDMFRRDSSQACQSLHGAICKSSTMTSWEINFVCGNEARHQRSEHISRFLGVELFKCELSHNLPRGSVAGRRLIVRVRYSFFLA